MTTDSITKRKSTYGKLSLMVTITGYVLPFGVAVMSGGDIVIILFSFMIIPPVCFLCGAIFAIKALMAGESHRILPVISLLIISSAVLWMAWQATYGGGFFHLNC